MGIAQIANGPPPRALNQVLWGTFFGTNLRKFALFIHELCGDICPFIKTVLNVVTRKVGYDGRVEDWITGASPFRAKKLSGATFAGQAIPYFAMPYLAIGIRTSTMGREKDICWTGTVVIAIKHIKAIPLIIFIIS